MPLEFLSYCVVLTLALVIQEAFYGEISLIWFSDNTVLRTTLKFMISSGILFNSFSFLYSSLLHAINAVPCSTSSHFYPLMGAAPYIKLCTRMPLGSMEFQSRLRKISVVTLYLVFHAVILDMLLLSTACSGVWFERQVKAF